MTTLLFIAVIVLAIKLYFLNEKLGIANKKLIPIYAEINRLNKFILQAESLKSDLERFENIPLISKFLERNRLPKFEEELNHLAFYDHSAHTLGLDTPPFPDSPPYEIKELPRIIQDTTAAMQQLQKQYPEKITSSHIDWIRYEEFEASLGISSQHPEYNDSQRWEHLENYLSWLFNEIEFMPNHNKDFISNPAFIKLKEIHAKLKK